MTLSKISSSPCGSEVEHSLGKGEVTSSSLVKGKFYFGGDPESSQGREVDNLIWVGARVAKGSRL